MAENLALKPEQQQKEYRREQGEFEYGGGFSPIGAHARGRLAETCVQAFGDGSPVAHGGAVLSLLPMQLLERGAGNPKDKPVSC